jgi:hypothetical protein
VSPGSPKVILLAKSEIHAIHVWHAVENPTYQPAGHRENDFAISIKSAEEPTFFTSVGNEADRVLLGRDQLEACYDKHQG